MATVTHIIDTNLPVYATGNQIISGVKNFASRPTVNGTGFLLSGEAANITLPTTIVYTTGNQTISGNKNFVENVTFGDQAQDNLFVVSGNEVSFGVYPTINGTGIVYTQGDQIISGTKTFASRPTVNGTGVLLIGEASSVTLPATILYTTGSQIISGNKTFNNTLSVRTISGLSGVGNATSIQIKAIDRAIAFGPNSFGGSVDLIGGSGSSVPGDINLYAGADSNGPYAGGIFALGNIYINDDNKSRSVVIYKTGAGATELNVSIQQSFVNVNNAFSISGVQVTPALYASSANLDNKISSLSGSSVLTFGTQNIFGTKSFISNTFFDKDITVSGNIRASGAAFFNDNLNVVKNLNVSGDLNINGSLSAPNVVLTRGRQTISGVKTFADELNLNAYTGNGYDNTNNEFRLNIGGNRNENVGIQIDAYGTNPPQILMRRARGNPTGLSGVLKNDVLFNLQARGYVSGLNAYSTNSRAAIRLIAAEDWVGRDGYTGQGTYVLFRSTNIGAGTAIDKVVISTSGLNVLDGDIYISGYPVVNTTSNQTISGNKNFVENVTFGDQTQDNLLVISGNEISFGVYPTVNGTGIVYTQGDQIISGVKTFASRPNVNGTGVLLSGEAANITLPNTIVYTTGDQLISGKKTFLNDIAVSGTGNFSNVKVSNIDKLYVSGVDVLVSNMDNLFLSGIDIVITGNSSVNVYNAIYISGNPVLTGVIPTAQTITNVVYTTGDQSISGSKTFASPIVFSSGANDGIYLGGAGGSIDLRGGDGDGTIGWAGGSIYSRGGLGGGGGSINTAGGDDGPGGSIDTSDLGGSINTSNGGGSINTSEGGSINTSNGGSINTSDGGSINTSNNGGNIDTSDGGYIYTSGNGGNIDTRGLGAAGGSITTVGYYDVFSYYNGGSINLSAGYNGNGGSINISDKGGSINLAGGAYGSGGFIDGKNNGGSIKFFGTSTASKGGSIDISAGYTDYGASFPSFGGGGGFLTLVGGNGQAEENEARGGKAGSIIGNGGNFRYLSGPPWILGDGYDGGIINFSAGDLGSGGSINISNGGGSINLSQNSGAGFSIQTGNLPTQNNGSIYNKINDALYIRKNGSWEKVITSTDNPVYATGNQTISGVKTFATGVNISGHVGIGINNDKFGLYVRKSAAGVTVNPDNGSIAVFEGSGNSHITVLASDAQSAGVVLGSPADNFGSYLSWNHDNNELKLATANPDGYIQLLTNTETQAVRITSAGNVGIGTISPSEKLQVVGNIKASGASFTNLPTVNNTGVLLVGQNSFVINLFNSSDGQLVGHNYFGNLGMGFSSSPNNRRFPILENCVVRKASWTQIVGTVGSPSLNSTGYFINTSTNPPQTGIISTIINTQSTTVPTHYTAEFSTPITISNGDFVVCSLFGPTYATTTPSAVRNSVNIYCYN